MGWDADDNADGHLDDPADDPRTPPGDEPDYRDEEGSSMDWTITPKQQVRSGMWQAVAVSGDGYQQVSALWATREQAEADARILADRYERLIGANRPELSPAEIIIRSVQGGGR